MNNPSFITLPMLRLPLSTEHKNTKSFEDHLNPVMLVFIGWRLAEYSQISTRVQWFPYFLTSFCIILNSPNYPYAVKGSSVRGNSLCAYTRTGMLCLVFWDEVKLRCYIDFFYMCSTCRMTYVFSKWNKGTWNTGTYITFQSFSKYEREYVTGKIKTYNTSFWKRAKKNLNSFNTFWKTCEKNQIFFQHLLENVPK